MAESTNCFKMTMHKHNFGLFSDPYKIGGNPHTGSKERTDFYSF